MSATAIIAGNAAQSQNPARNKLELRRKTLASTKKRSRGGCLTCKQKHAKCDEARPSCRNCSRKGLTCGGYSRGFTWSYKHQSGPRTAEAKQVNRRSSQSTENEKDYAPSPASSKGDAPLVDSNFASSLLPVDDAFYASDDCQPILSQYWPPASVFANEDALACLDRSMGLPPNPWPLDSSASEQVSFPRGFRVTQDIPLPTPLRGGPETVDRLITNWFEQVCPIWSAFDSCFNQNRKIASELMHHSAAVFNTLQSMSASYLSARLPQMKQPALRLLKTATATILSEADSLRGRDIPNTVPTGLLFSLFCVGTSVCWLDASRLGLPFLQEAKCLLQRLSWQDIPRTDDQLEILAFFKKSLLYWEMLLSFVDDYDPGSDSESREQENRTSHARNTRDTSTDAFPHPWTGISSQTSRLFSQSIRLCRSYRRRVSKPSGSEVALSAAMQEMQEARKLEEHLLGLEFSSATPVNHTGDERTPWLHLAYVAEAYQLASLLQLYLTFPGLVALRLPSDSGLETSGSVPCDKWTIPLALRLTKLLEQIPPESGSRVIQPLLYICASTGLCYNISPCSLIPAYEADTVVSESRPVTLGGLDILGYVNQMDTNDGDQSDAAPVPEIAVEIGNARNFILRRLDTLACTLHPRPIVVAKQLVEQIWAAYDDESRGCTSGHWLDVMEAQDLRSLFG
ncbi:hypothetical protein MANI_024386 [Metarhizium anisopliae]